LLYCEECGCCSGELGKGWVAYTCAASEFGYRPAFAETYVCAWEPLPEETTDVTLLDP
jgi:hypothetical protein